MIPRDSWLPRLLAGMLKDKAATVPPFLLPNKDKPRLSMPNKKPMFLTDEVLQKFAPRSVDFANGLNMCVDKYQIDTPKRLAAWLGQLHIESGGFAKVSESLNYSVEGLMSTFGRHRISESECVRYGRTASQKANQQMIANTVYGGEWGKKNLGNTQPGDGWMFKGRGLVQVTGRKNYHEVSLALFGDTKLWDRPEMLEQFDYAAQSAGWFWYRHGLNSLADAWDIARITKVINGGASHLAERKAQSERALKLLA